MTSLESSRCRFCTRTFCYPGAYERHLAREHPHAVGRPGNGNREPEKGKGRHGSDCEDYEDIPELDSRPKSTSEIYPEAGKPIRDAPEIQKDALWILEHPWYPFANAHEFKQARWMIESRISKKNIDRYFRDGLSSTSDVTFTSARTLYQLLDGMNQELGPDSWSVGESNWSLAGGVTRKISYYYRSPLTCIQYLLKQPCYREHLVYAPVKEYNEAGERMYSEMHTAEWWWSIQETLPPGSTILPVICASDQTHLTNFSGDKKAWPVYLTLGNILSTVRNKPSLMAMILVALLPVPPKLITQKAAQVDAQRKVNRRNLHSVLERVFQPMCNPGQHGIELSCADGKVRRCFPILAAWLADHEEHTTLHNLARNRCPKCEVNPESLGELREFPRRDHEAYQQKIRNYHRTKDITEVTDLVAVGLRAASNGLWILPRIQLSDIHKPDLLHNVYLGLLKNLLEWITAFLKQHNRLDHFDNIWRSMPPYPGFSPPRKAFREVSQWQGKEMRMFGRIILPAMAIALREPSASQRPLFNRALECVRNLVDFHLMAQYRSHTTETLTYLDDYLKGFHDTKDVFLEFRQSKTSKKKAEAQDKQLRKRYAEEDADENALRVGSSAKSKRQRLGIARKEERDAQRLEIMERESHFNYPKMHLATHFHDHILRFGNLPMYSTEIGESSHRTQIKEGYQHSNHNDYVNQILGYYRRHHALHMRQENLRALQRNNKTPGNDIPDNDVLAVIGTPAEERSQAPPLRHLHAQQRDCHIIADIQQRLSVFNHGLDLCKLLTTYSRLNLPLEQRLPNDNDRLLNLAAKIFNQLEVPVPAFKDPHEHEIHRIRCADSFRHLGPRHDWAWIKAGDDNQFGALRGQLPGQIGGLFKIRDQETGYSHRLAVVRLLRPGPTGGSIDPHHGLVRVQRSRGNPGSDFAVINITSICGIAHILPVFPSRGDECESWLVNSRIDLSTFNNIY